MNRIFIMGILPVLFLCGCNKFLDEKSDQKLVTPTKIEDLQALLNNHIRNSDRWVYSPVSCADEYFLTQDNYGQLDEYQRNMYTWSGAYYNDPTAATNDWITLYDLIYVTNVILSGLENVERSVSNAKEWDDVKGQALFLRSYAFFTAATIYSPAYDPATAASDLGVVLRVDPDFNIPSIRSSVNQTYELIVHDLKESLALLPPVSIHPVRAGKVAALGLLSRVYLSMNAPDSCLTYADECLSIKSDLMDYNNSPSIKITAQYPFNRFNPEVIFDVKGGRPVHLTNAYINKELYDSYEEMDLRKELFHRGAEAINDFKGTYSGTIGLFYGIATDEIYLNRAESYARLGKTKAAIDDLNTLLIKRWKTDNPFVPLNASTQDEAIGLILNERKKELVFRGLRWMDLKRLNKAGAEITITRKLEEGFINLLPNSSRYAMPIPEDIIVLTGMEQNN
ncbi:SusD family protein [bacterium A37T11]|nr:SusD family protein [bacterium A37T11]